MKVVYLWERQDGGQPKCIAVDALPPGPGAVYAVRANTAKEARAVLAAAKRLLSVDMESDPVLWGQLKAQAKRVEVHRV